MEIRSVLVAEDDRGLLAAYKKGFQTMPGVENVYAAERAARARELALAHRPDACVFDMHLATHCGIELMRELKPELRDTRFLIVSGWNDTETVKAALRAGAADVVDKPAEVSELMARLRGDYVPARNTASESADLHYWKHVRRVVARCDGNISEAARRLQVGRATVQCWLDKPRPK